MHNKAAVVTKMNIKMLNVKSICLGVQLDNNSSRCTADFADSDFVWCNKFIDTFPTSLLTLICKFLTFL